MYKEKYLKYKSKYLELKNELDSGANIIQEGGSPPSFLSWLFGKNKHAAEDKKAVDEKRKYVMMKVIQWDKDNNVVDDDWNKTINDRAVTYMMEQLSIPRDYIVYNTLDEVVKEITNEKMKVINMAAAVAERAKLDKEAAINEAIMTKIDAQIDNKTKSSNTFAYAYKTLNSNSHKISFQFIVIKKYKITKIINGESNTRDRQHDVIDFYHSFIYESAKKEIYMSDDTYSPIMYNNYFRSNKLNINIFFKTFVELLIYTSVLKTKIKILTKDDIDKFLMYLLQINKYIKFLFNINIDLSVIKTNYKKYKKYDNIHENYESIPEVITDEKYELEHFFIINRERIPLSMESIRTKLGFDDIDEFKTEDFFINTKARMITLIENLK